MNFKSKQNFHRVIDFLKECPNNLTPYPELKEDLKLLCAPGMKESITSNLPYILPGLLILAASSEESVMHEIVPLYSVINDTVSKNTSLKTESWWKQMESNIVPNKFCTGLTKLIEKNNDFWAQTWIFAVSLMVNDTQVQGSTVNSLLKIMEIAFKKSLTDSSGSILDRAFFCWIRFIEIFTNNPRILHTKKLIGLLVRPLTIPMGTKSHLKIIETYKYIFEKVGKTEDKTIVMDIVNPFLEYSYMKNEHPFSKTHPNECCEILLLLLSETDPIKKIHIFPVLSAYSYCVESKPLEETLLKLWSSILDSSDIVDTNDYEQYLEEIMSQRQKVLRNNEVLKDYEKLREHLMNHGLPNITPELLDKLLTSSALSPKILADMMEYDDFRTKTLANYFNQFINNVNFEMEKRETSNTSHMEAWDTFCAAFNLFIESKGYNFQDTDSHTFKSLILFPLQTYAKWAGVTQRTWHALIDSVDKIGILKVIIPDIILTLNLNIDSNKVNISTVIDIISHLVNIDKNASITSTINKILAKLPKDDPKNAIDLLAFIENLIGQGDKKQYLSGVLSELLRICTCYDQLYEHRIKTKVSKLHRKLIIDSKNDKNDKAKESKTPSPKIRSPLLTGSNFLHRLAKSEEKKAMSSISPPVLGDRNAKTSSKLTKDLESDKDDIVHKDIDQEEAVKAKEEITLPTSVNIVVTNNSVKTNNVSIKKTPDNHTKLNGKLQNGDCRFSIMGMKPVVPIKKTAICYFEDDSQEFVVVTSKPKANTPLTEHQKEKMLQRKSDIPALYQDLSQDTQSISNLLVKDIPEILITPENEQNDKKSDETEKINLDHLEKLETSKESLEVIEVTPPCQDLLTTPTKSSPYSTVNKKLNFEGLVKASSPLCNEKQQHNNDTKNSLLHQNSITPTSRRISYRKTTSKYGAHRISDTKESSDSTVTLEVSPKTDDLSQAKCFIKQGVISKKVGQDTEQVLDKKKDSSVFNEKYASTYEKKLDETNLSSDNIMSEHHEKEVLVLELYPSDKEASIDFISSNNCGKEVDVRNEANNDNRELGIELSLGKDESAEKDNRVTKSDESKNKEITGEVKNAVDEKEVDEFSTKHGHYSKLQHAVESSKPDSVSQNLITPEKNHSIESPVKKSDVEHVTPVSERKSSVAPKEGDKGDGHDNVNKLNSSKNDNSENKTPPTSQQKARRPRKMPPTPFSPKLTRSKKLSLQNKEKSPKSPKESKLKIRAPKPNTESFSSDSNDSLTGITPLEKNKTNAVVVGVEEKEDIVSQSAKNLDEAEDNLGKENKIVTLYKDSDLSKDLKDAEKNEPISEKLKLSECNENIELKKRNRKRKLPPSPEGNDENNSVEVKHVSAAKRGKRRKGFGTTRLNSHSPKLTSGLEHWLYKKDKTTIKPTNEDLSENKTSENLAKSKTHETVISENPVDKSLPDDKISLRCENEIHSKESESMEKIECDMNLTNEQDIKDTEYCEGLEDTEILTCEESVEPKENKNSDTLELIADDIIAGSQNAQDSEDIFGSITKKVKTPSIEINIEPSSASGTDTTTEAQITGEEAVQSSGESTVSPTVTKVEKISNGMNACDLIFKGVEVEEKITIYMEQRPFSPPNEVLISPRKVDSRESENPKDQDGVSDGICRKAAVFHRISEVDNEEEIKKSACLDNKRSELISASSMKEEKLAKSSSSVVTSTESDLVQMDTASLIELVEKDIALIDDDVQDSLHTNKDEEKFSSSLVEKEDEVLPVENKEDFTEVIDMEMSDGIDIDVSKPTGNESDTETKITLHDSTDKASVTSPNDIQNDSEHLFKTDTPKRRGARFIHTTEREEDGGDTAEERRKRNIRSRRVNVEDINNLGSNGRSKHMVQLAQQGRNSRINAPRRRPNVVPITYGANWPTGPTEEWVGTRPSTPVPCSSPGILKASPAASASSTTSLSPPQKKKRVNFLDPPVSTGLLYEKGNKVGIGQLHYAELSPGKKRPWICDEESTEKKTKKVDDSDGDQWQEQKAIQPAIEVEVLSPDDSAETLVTDNEISENLSLNEKISADIVETVPSTSEKSEETISTENTAHSVAIPSTSKDLKEVQPQISDVKISEEEENVFENKDDGNNVNIPTVEQLKLYFNNTKFINNLSLVINASGEQIFWCQQFFNSLLENSKK